MVECVEELRAEFDVHAFTPRKSKAFPRIQVRTEQMRPVNQPAAGIPNGVLRGEGKYGCVEPLTQRLRPGHRVAADVRGRAAVPADAVVGCQAGRERYAGLE